jgi:broad specificity phosphatase PhoE
MADLWLVRHGQAGEVMGDYDRLSDKGWAQSRHAGSAWRQLAPVHHVIIGGMRRHRETAEGFGETFGLLPAPVVDEGWNEFDHQAVVRAALAAGLSPGESPGRAGFFAFFEAAMGRWASGAHDDDYPEAYAAFQSRVVAALQRSTRTLERGQTGVVFTSGGAISAVCRHLWQLEPHAAFRINQILGNGGFTRIRVGAGRTSLVSLNVLTHFDDAPDLLTGA